MLITACQKYKNVRGVGIEIDPVAANNARNNVGNSKLEKSHRDSRTGRDDHYDVHRAEYIFLYLLPKGNEKIEKILRERMNDRCRIVCYMFKLPDRLEDDKFGQNV